ncbi:MAG TPA: hypothetical protein ENN39_05010 [Desulfonatronum sp.]|nr:hypothetical protein [Desulfonatronum sp.]
MEAVLNQGVAFLSGLLEMATGRKIAATDDKRMIEVDRQTGEVGALRVSQIKLKTFRAVLLVHPDRVSSPGYACLTELDIVRRTISLTETMTGADFMLETPNRPPFISQQAAVSSSMTQGDAGESARGTNLQLCTSSSAISFR